MLISIDYDDTFTADPSLWWSFIKRATWRGHKILCVSARTECVDSRREL